MSDTPKSAATEAEGSAAFTAPKALKLPSQEWLSRHVEADPDTDCEATSAMAARAALLASCVASAKYSILISRMRSFGSGGRGLCFVCDRWRGDWSRFAGITVCKPCFDEAHPADAPPSGVTAPDAELGPADD